MLMTFVAQKQSSMVIFDYFFLYPTGHLGLIAVTFLDFFPLIQIIVFFFGAGFLVVVTVGTGVAETV